MKYQSYSQVTLAIMLPANHRISQIQTPEPIHRELHSQEYSIEIESFPKANEN